MENRILETMNSMIGNETDRFVKKMRGIQSRARFMLYKGVITNEEYVQILNRTLIDVNIKSDYTENILLYRMILSDYYSKVIELYKNYNVKGNFDVFDDKDIEKLFHNFLMYVGCEKLFDTIKKKGMIVFPKKLEEYGGFTLYYGRLSYIVVEDCSDKIVLYESLAHEMGHVLYNNVLYDNKGYRGYVTIGNEIISILLEKMFLDFLLTNSNLDKETIKKHIRADEEVYLNLTKTAKKGLDLLDNPNIQYSFNGDRINYTYMDKDNTLSMYDNNYAIGNIVAAKIMENSENDMDYFIKHLKDIIRKIETLSPEQLIEEYFDLESVKKNLDKRLVKKKR